MKVSIKDLIIVGLSSFIIVLIVLTYFMKDSGETVTITKKVPVERVNYDVELVKKWMIRVGVSDAWVEEIKGTGVADCFSTIMFPDKSALSYCQLR